MNRSGKAAAVMVLLLTVSLVLLFFMPAESDGTVDWLVTFGSVALYVASIAMVGAVVYFRRVDDGSRDARPVPDDEIEEEYRDEISEIEREFEALEKEIEQEERS